MAELDLTKLGNITITNSVETKPAFDAGTKQIGPFGDYDFNGDKDTTDEGEQNVPILVTDRTVQLYKCNSFITLKQGDSVKITVASSDELKYYMSLNGKDGLVVEEAGA